MYKNFKNNKQCKYTFDHIIEPNIIPIKMTEKHWNGLIKMTLFLFIKILLKLFVIITCKTITIV